MKSIVDLLKEYDYPYYLMTRKPLIREDVKYVGGCYGNYPSHYGIDTDYYESVLNADERDDE